MSLWNHCLVLLIPVGIIGCADANLLAADSSTPGSDRQQPNILLIVADDLGYSDIGAYGGEISTPNLDALAHQGLATTNFHTAATCSPTRTMLLSGTDNHPAGMATMPGHLSANQAGKPGYEMFFNNRAFSIASLLKRGGYHTYIAGKWHIGSKPEHRPNRRGFERSFVLLEGGASHFDDQLGPTSKFPKAHYVANGEPVETLPEGFFSTDFYTDTIIDYIERDRNDDKPFFAIVAYTAPHWPLQAPEAYLEKYRGKYDQGYQAIVAQRLKKMQQLGLVDTENNAYPGGIDDWQQLSATERKVASRKMEIYAAMVNHMDDSIGRLLEYLKKSGAYENTLVVFISDNGPEGGNPLNLHDNKEWVPKTFDNSFENMGKRGSYIYYGPSWGQVSATPHRGFKTTAYEGGITVPMIISHPTSDYRKGIDDSFISVKDLAPTFLELAGLNYLTESDGTADKLPMTGRSILPFLQNEESQVHPNEYAMGWEILGRYGVRKGNWKAVHADTGWQVFDLVEDPAEQHDMSKARPDKLAELTVAWDRYVKNNGVVLPTENVAY